ncbi:AAA-ATPase At2g46620-like [Primulina tabacum]|uniref:AAA-ATPase At2g46620-like n=1 Tax=Primulina tabacum TaxID=48773 RepID=UPI003F59F9F1
MGEGKTAVQNVTKKLALEQKMKEVSLFVKVHRNGRWRSISLTHPATMEMVVMDSDLKTRIKSDLDNFLKPKQFYHRLGKVWKRSYLLYGSAGTGKSTFIAAVAKFLGYDINEINLHRITSDSNLKCLLLQTTNKSLLVVEDLYRYLGDKSTAVSLSGILNFMDGVISSCGEERVMIFTMNSKENIDASFLRPGRIDVHIYFPLCDFTAFKSLANSHLGLKDHKLFSRVEENFQIGATLSPAEIGGIMVSNRGSPTRSSKTVITALQGNLASRVGRRSSGSTSGRDSEELSDSSAVTKDGQNGVHPMKKIKNLYGLSRARSSRKASMKKLDMHMNERENSDLNTT